MTSGPRRVQGRGARRPAAEHGQEAGAERREKSHGQNDEPPHEREEDGAFEQEGAPEQISDSDGPRGADGEAWPDAGGRAAPADDGQRKSSEQNGNRRKMGR